MSRYMLIRKTPCPDAMYTICFVYAYLADINVFLSAWPRKGHQGGLVYTTSTLVASLCISGGADLCL
jgi:hypothetical protein